MEVISYAQLKSAVHVVRNEEKHRKTLKGSQIKISTLQQFDDHDQDEDEYIM